MVVFLLEEYNLITKSGAIFLMVLILVLLSYPASAAWPNDSQWNPVMKNSIYLEDQQGDGTAFRDLVGNQTFFCCYVFNNGSALFFRIRVDADPTGNKNGLAQQGKWGVEISTDGIDNTYEYLIMLEASNLSLNIEYNFAGAVDDPSDATDGTNASYSTLGYTNTSTASSDFGGTADYFVSWYVPYYDFLNITRTSNFSALRLYFGTSNSGHSLFSGGGGGGSDLVNGTTLSSMKSDPVTPKGTTTTNGTVAFVNSSYQGNVTFINVSDTLYVRLNDTDRNTDNTSINTVAVVLLTETGDNETLTLTETSITSGIFTGSILTNYSYSNYLTNSKLEVRPGVLFNVTYNDTTSNGNFTNRIATASVKPLVNVSYTSPVEYGSSSNLTINISDYHPDSYIVYKNGTNVANGSYSDGVPFNVSVDSNAITTWNYTVWANDTSGNTNATTVWITVQDTTTPTIFYNTPPTAVNNSVVNDNFFTVDVTAYDLNLKNITINLYNKSTGNLLNSQISSGILTSTYTFQVIFTGLSNGDYLFNATANDTSGNSNTTATRNVTVLVTGGTDLNLASQNITFVYETGEASEVTEAGEARENINLTINATIYNQGSSSSGAFYVLFYDGNSQFYNASMNSMAAGGNANSTAYWTTLVGTHNITVRVDPNDGTGDSDRSNNNASKLINVSAWQKYYGNATGNYMLANYLATSMRNWTWNNETNIGYLYVVNQSASINWSALHPLGYDRNNAVNSSGQDFQDADTNLGMVTGTDNATGFRNNNITELFTNTTGSNYGNVAINTTSFVVFGRTINNVPIVNSTDTTSHNAVGSANFITGILWDDTKDINGYYDTADKEELVFITKIRQAASGLMGSAHNYEISVPYSLNLMTGHEVNMYMELT